MINRIRATSFTCRPPFSIHMNFLGALISCCLLLLVSSFARAQIDDDSAQIIGTIALLKGEATAGFDAANTRQLSKGSPIYLNDVIQTAEGSFVAIKFSDGGRLTLQPGSQLHLQDYNQKTGYESQTFKLLKGALRTITGAIGKRSPQNVDYLAGNLTIGIRGTTFVLKLCESSAALSGDGCDFAESYNFNGRLIDNKPPRDKKVQLFLSTHGEDQRQSIEATDLSQYLPDSYVGVIDGKIRVDTGTVRIDMEVVENCFDPNAPAASNNGKSLPPCKPQANTPGRSSSLPKLPEKLPELPKQGKSSKNPKPPKSSKPPKK